MEEKVIADGIAKAKEEIIVRNREMEEKLQAEILAMNGLVEELQREQLSSVQRMADPERVNGEEKTEVAPERRRSSYSEIANLNEKRWWRGLGKSLSRRRFPGSRRRR